MSEIKALEELREKLERDTSKTKLYPTAPIKHAFAEGVTVEGYRALADAIKAEIAERFMELPVDADGVPILLDDVVEPDGDEPFEVRALMLDASGWFVIERLGSNWAAKQVHHVKPRTLEDALADMANNIAMQVDGRIHHWKASDFGDEAAEIRELLGVDA